MYIDKVFGINAEEVEEMEVGNVITNRRGQRYRLLDKTEENDCIGFVWEKLNKTEPPSIGKIKAKTKKRIAKRSKVINRKK